jgi:hypothetical protein
MNFQQETNELLQTLPLDIVEKITQAIEWEKELSWSNGYADCEEQMKNFIHIPITQVPIKGMDLTQFKSMDASGSITQFKNI